MTTKNVPFLTVQPEIYLTAKFENLIVALTTRFSGLVASLPRHYRRKLHAPRTNTYIDADYKRPDCRFFH